MVAVAKSRMIGQKAHIARLKKLTGPEMVREVGAALFQGGERIEVEASISITANSTNAKGQHVRSLPGEPPNEEFGDLRRGLQTVQVAPLVVEVSANAAHSAPLELGTSKMAARPFMAPARDAKRKEVEQLVKRAVNRVVKRSRSPEKG